MKPTGLFFIFLLFSIISCQSPGSKENSLALVEEAAMPMMDKQMERAGGGDMMVNPEAAPLEVMITKEVWMQVEIVDFNQDLDSIRQLIVKSGGVVNSENENSSDHSLDMSLTIKVPANNLDSLVSGIAKVSRRVVHRNVETRDVGEEYHDMDARLRTRKEVEKRYLELLRKAKTVEDIIRVEQQLRMIREEVEAAQARLNYLSGRVTNSTLYLTVSQPLTGSASVDLFHGIGRAVKIGWKGFLIGIIFLFKLWPLFLLTLIGLWAYRVYKSKKKTRKRSKKLEKLERHKSHQ